MKTLEYLMVSGGPDGEAGASLRYLSQRFSTPYNEVKAILTDIGMSGIKMSQSKKQRTSLAATGF